MLNCTGLRYSQSSDARRAGMVTVIVVSELLPPYTEADVRDCRMGKVNSPYVNGGYERFRFSVRLATTAAPPSLITLFGHAGLKESVLCKWNGTEISTLLLV